MTQTYNKEPRCDLSDLFKSEQWRAIPGHVGHYEVSSEGRVWSHRLHRPLVAAEVPGRYKRVNLRRPDGGREIVDIHVLMALAFIGPRPEGQEVRHLNGNPYDNRLANLAYGTRSDQRRDDVQNKVNPFSKRTHCAKGHEYTPENTVWRVNQGRRARSCLECKRAYERAYYQRRRDALRAV